MILLQEVPVFNAIPTDKSFSWEAKAEVHVTVFYCCEVERAMF